MENQRTQTKVAMNYGTLYGLSSIAVYMLFYFLKTDVESKLPQICSYLLMILFIIMGIKSYRDEDLGGHIGYGKSLGTGVLISVFGGILTGVFSLIFFSYIAPEMTQKILEATQQKLAEKGLSEEQVEQGMSMTQKFMTPTWLFVFSVIGSAFMGFIFSLLISIFMKKEQNPFNSNIG